MGGRRSLRDWVTSWTARRKAEVKPATYAFYRGTGDRWLAWLGGRADGPMDAVTIEDLIAYRNHMESEVTPKTCNHALTFIRMVFLAAHNEGVIDRNPARLLKPVRAEEDHEGRQPFTADQLGALLAAADDEWCSMILCGAYTGQRLADVATLEWKRVDLVAGTISLRTRKTGRFMTLPLAAALWDFLRAREVDASGYLHPRSAGHIVRTNVSCRLSNQFADIMTAAGIRKPSTETPQGRRRVKNVHSFHSLRHTATSWMKAANIPLSVVMDFIGHSDAAMSQLYTHTGDDALRKAAGSLPDITKIEPTK
jgi:integrase